MAKNFPNIERDLDIPVHEAHGLPNKLNLKISSSRHIIIKLSKIKENLKSSKAKQVWNLQGNPHMLISGFLNRNLRDQERDRWYIQSAEKTKNKMPNKNTLSSKVSFRNKGEIKDFPRQAKAEGVHY